MKLYAIGFFLSWIAITGMTFAHYQAEYPRWMPQSVREQKQDLGFAIIWGGACSILWPITLPSIYILFGFGQDGWSVTFKNRE